MAASIPGILSDSLGKEITSSKILVVGAGGIGCELLKNLVLTGFNDIEIIDLDTIDVSNLNRQFLFHKQHVGKSKSNVARETALLFNPDVSIKSYHDSITSPDYGVFFFKRFKVVLNALDNRAARSHVNRLCLAADVPLIESGSAGYMGQVTVIKKGESECYECVPKGAQRNFPGCTIRNTPSEPIHCIVWAKHLFNQLFGEADPDEDVSPDTADPEAVGEAGDAALSSTSNNEGNVDRVSTRSWAQECNYDPKKLFHKLFHDDIKYLLSMENLWKKRKPPTPLDWDTLPDAVAGVSSGSDSPGIRDQRLWSVAECSQIMAESCEHLRDRLQALPENDHLVWDKDDDDSMNFVAGCANIRAHAFSIAQKTRFDIKSMAGNIIPAIATTNAVIAGIIVIEAFKVLEERIKDCRTTYLCKSVINKKVITQGTLIEPNPKCYVCSSKPEVILKLNPESILVKTLEDRILKGSLNMVAPDVEIDDGKGTILISSEEGETDTNNDKSLATFGIRDGSRLKCDDFLQEYNLNITILQCSVDDLPQGTEFEVIADKSELQAKKTEDTKNETKEQSQNGTTNGSGKKEKDIEELSDDEDLMAVDFEDKVTPSGEVISRKRAGSPTEEPAAKKPRPAAEQTETDDIIVL